MQVVFHNFYGKKPIHILPLFDIHLGALACNEEALRRSLDRIYSGPRVYTIGGGDYAEYITKSDKRFDIGSLAPWMVTKESLSDPARAQTERIIEYFKPISKKFLGLISGNHEGSIYKYHERDVLGEVCRGIGRPELAMGYEGWLVLNFYETERSVTPDHVITIRLHHGFGGGKGEGAPMIAMQTMMFTNAADLTLMGHIHRRAVANPAVVERLDTNGNLVHDIRKGAYCGTFLATRIVGPSTYSAISGYTPTMAVGSPLITINPWASQPESKVEICS